MKIAILNGKMGSAGFQPAVFSEKRMAGWKLALRVCLMSAAQFVALIREVLMAIKKIVTL